MHINARGWVSVAELIVFIPLFFLSFFICLRHGFRKSSGWIYTVILCTIRIVGSICQLCTYNNHSTNLLEATFIIDSIGLTPLLFATLSLLSRAIDWAKSEGQNININARHLILIHAPIAVGLVLSIVGGTSSNINETTGTIHIATTSKIGILLYIAGYAAIVLVSLIAFRYVKGIRGEGMKIVIAVGLALPLIAVRLLYAVLSVFVHNHTFNILDGSAGALVGMSVLEEFLVVIIYVCLGFKLPRMNYQGQRDNAPREQYAMNATAYKAPEQV